MNDSNKTGQSKTMRVYVDSQVIQELFVAVTGLSWLSQKSL